MKIRNNNWLDKGTNIIAIIALGFVVFLSYTMLQLSVFVAGVIIVILVRKIIFYIVYGSFREQADLIDYMDKSNTDKRNVRKAMKQIKEENKKKDNELIRKLKEEKKEEEEAPKEDDKKEPATPSETEAEAGKEEEKKEDKQRSGYSFRKHV